MSQLIGVSLETEDEWAFEFGIFHAAFIRNK